jgi:hypothetical protein
MLGHGQQSEGASASWEGFQDRIRNLEASVRSRDTKGADRTGATSLKPD